MAVGLVPWGATVAVTAIGFHLVTTGLRGGVWRGKGLAALMVVTLTAGWLVDALIRRRVPGRLRLARAGPIIGLALLSAPAVQWVRITPKAGSGLASAFRVGGP